MFGWKKREDKRENNRDHILRVCIELIQEYEDEAHSVTPSCKEDLMSAIRSLIDQSSDEVKNWPSDVDYIRIAHTLIANLTFDLLASGKYHLYRGILNPMNCSSSLMKVYRKTMDWGHKNNQFTKEVLDEQYHLLQERISEVG